jgi:hypothetical protein
MSVREVLLRYVSHCHLFGEACAEETECCGGHGTKVSRLSKAYGCDGTSHVVLFREAPMRVADTILKACVVQPVQSVGRQELLPLIRFSDALVAVSHTTSPHKVNRGNRGVCMTRSMLIVAQPLYFAAQQSIYLARGARHVAMMSAVWMWSLLLTIMNEISFDVLSPLNWPKLNWHSANLPVHVLTAVSAGAPFLFSLERLAL